MLSSALFLYSAPLLCDRNIIVEIPVDDKMGATMTENIHLDDYIGLA